MHAKRKYEGKSKSNKKFVRKITNPLDSGVTPYTPLYKAIRLVDKRKFPVVQQINVNIPYFPATGFNNTSYDICFGVIQSNAVYQQNNGAWSNSNAFNNCTSLAYVFQMYRIIAFEIDVWFSNNSAGNTSGSTTGNALPILYAIQDREDARSILTEQSMLQYASCKVMQMGDTRKHTIKMVRPSVFVANDNDATLVGTLTASQLQYSPWLSCGTNVAGNTPAAIPHGYLKFLVDPCGNTNVQSSGTFTFVIRGLFEYRGID